jgi:hypothetical protein
MAKCNNCNANLGCSCQRRTASNGTSVCSNCVSSYERNLKQLKNDVNNIDNKNY